ncbi:cytochrome-b5 reductase [Malassezia cuniculi]|uniref:cytochrome-b5 reductase n=1 Tax=Malassezia cuniculi TaxID=948313 RepID=A0AAF0EVH3_9BASI|nr:cytochrome-b5 reductase [Malassezia cuniculi]
MFVRTASACTPALRHAATRTLPTAASATRMYSSAAPKANSNTGLYFSLAGVAGIASWFALGGFNGDLRSKLAEIRADSGETALNKDEWRSFKIKEIRPYNHDSSIYVFETPAGTASGIVNTSALLMTGDVKDENGKPVVRPYTPIEPTDTKGHIDLLIKHYPNGKMTQYLKSLKVGDEVSLKGPIPKFPYKANQFNHIGLIAGGSGVTPIWQVVQAIASDKSDNTKVTVLYCNNKEEDILLRERFDKIAKEDKRFEILYCLTEPSKGWTGFTGYITPEIIKKHLPSASNGDKIKVFVCGPPPQMKAVCGPKKSAQDQGELKGFLADLGYKAEQVFKF